MTHMALVMSLAWQDYRADARLSACTVLALIAVIAPLLVLFGLKFGLVSNLIDGLEREPLVRELIPLGGSRIDGAFIDALRARPDVAFAMPRTRQIAATVDLSVPAQSTVLNAEMIPTGEGDPLLEHLPMPVRLDTVVLSHTAAEKLGVRAGAGLNAAFTRQRAGRLQVQRTRLNVIAVLPLAAFARDAVFARLTLLEAAEDYRDGRAVTDLGWEGDAPSGVPRVYPAMRLYARHLSDVEPLRRYLVARDLPVSTQANVIAQVMSLSRNLSIVFWIIAALAMAGACAAIVASALSAVERKFRELSVLRLLGFSAGALLTFVVLQALYSGLLAAGLSALLYVAAERGINSLFADAPGEYACRLLWWHYGVVLLVSLGASAAAALLGGWRVTRMEASRGIRHV
jgi:putative ABC transport system permease protein